MLAAGISSLGLLAGGPLRASHHGVACGSNELANSPCRHAAIALLQDAPPRSPEKLDTSWPGIAQPDDFTDPNYSWSNEGRPSMVGWRPGQLDRLTQWAQADQANRPIICEYKPDALWLWSQYRGTVLSITIVPVLLTVSLALGLDAAAHASSEIPWGVTEIPPADNPLIQQLGGLNKLWEYQLSLATFILTFFTSQAYQYWRNVYFTTRAIQGRINDVCLLISLGAERGVCDMDSCDVDAMALRPGFVGYSDEGAQLVRRCTRLIKKSHTFFWAATPTCSNGLEGSKDEDPDAIDDRAIRRGADPIGPLLLSAEGLEQLVQAGELTAKERQALLESGLPPSQYAFILLQWVGLYAMGGLKAGTLRGSNGFEENLLRQLTGLRAEYFNVGDYAAGRMPLAYVQLVQVLIDSLVLLAPFSLYPELGSLAIPATGLLTLFFKGLLELSKSFLDPFGNEGYPGQNIRVDVLVSELNFGASSRWAKAGAALPDEEGETPATTPMSLGLQ